MRLCRVAKVAVAEMQRSLKALDSEIEALRRDALEHVHGAAQQRALVANLGKQKHDQTHRLQLATEEKAAGGRGNVRSPHERCDALMQQRDRDVA